MFLKPIYKSAILDKKYVSKFPFVGLVKIVPNTSVKINIALSNL